MSRTENNLLLHISVFLLLSISALCDEFEDDILKEHNKYRKKHGANKLRLDPGLTIQVQQMAVEIAKGKLAFDGSTRGYSLCETAYHPISCIRDWYKEKKHYSFKKSRRNKKSLHFTQLVWKPTERIGIGLSKRQAGNFVLLIKYDPPGNWGNFNQNVAKKNSKEGIHKAYSINYLVLLSWLFSIFSF